MVRKSRRNLETRQVPSKEGGVKKYERPSPESEALFPSYLSPIVQCKKSVLERSRFEFYLALVLGVFLAIVPMNSVTRSIFLLFVLAPLIDVVWRSSFTHSVKRTSKVVVTVLLVLGYLIISSTLIIREHGSIKDALIEYMQNEGILRFMFFLSGAIIGYGGTQLRSILRRYRDSRREIRLAEQKRFLEAQKGWLDYRLQSEESSKRLHHFVSRIITGIGQMGAIAKRSEWFIGRGSPLAKAQGAAFMVALMYNRYSKRLETDLDELNATADVFIESTQGHLRRLRANTKAELTVIAGIHEYFQAQLKDVRDMVDILEKHPPTNELRGMSQELDAAINRQWAVWRAQINIMRRVQSHCGKMVKTTQGKWERALLKASQELLANMQEVIKIVQKWEKPVKQLSSPSVTD